MQSGFRLAFSIGSESSGLNSYECSHIEFNSGSLLVVPRLRHLDNPL